MSHPHQSLESSIRQILVEDWDPIGVMDDPEWPSDEYDTYIGQLYEMLSRGESAESVARHLCFIEDKLMGLGAVPDAMRLHVALKLKALALSDGTG